MAKNTISFKEVVDYIAYDWDSNYDLKKDNEGNYYVNKLYITPETLNYKTESYPITKIVFNKVEKLYEMLNE